MRMLAHIITSFTQVGVPLCLALEIELIRQHAAHTINNVIVSGVATFPSKCYELDGKSALSTSWDRNIKAKGGMLALQTNSKQIASAMSVWLK